MGGDNRFPPEWLKVRVPRFAAHPSGFTIYELVVELLETRQVFSTFRRFSEFKILRRELRAVAKATDGGETTKRSKEIAALLARCSFPSGMLGSNTRAMKEERRSAFGRFLQGLVRLDPLPRVAADFLGLLHDKRLSLDSSGRYVVVTPIRDILPLLDLPLATAPAADGDGGDGGESAAAADTEAAEDEDGYIRVGGGTAESISGRSGGAAEGVLGGGVAEGISRGGAAGEGDAATAGSLTDCDSGTDDEDDEEVEVEVEAENSPGAAAAQYLPERSGAGTGPAAASTQPAAAAAPARCAGGEAAAAAAAAGAGNGAAAQGAAAHGAAAPGAATPGAAAPGAAAPGIAAPGPPVRATSARMRPVEERVLLWEFVQGFLEQVAQAAVDRQQRLLGLSLASLPGLAAQAGKGGSGAVAAAATAPSGMDEEERNLRIGELLSLNVSLPPDQVVLLLRYCDWAPNQAAALYGDLISAGKGMLEPVPRPAARGGAVSVKPPQLRGAENGGNTCYIDSLLFAMFGTLDAFDWLLQKPLRPQDPPAARLLQKHLRFFVSQLRRGAVIPAEHARLLRRQLKEAGWAGGASTQEDVSELFTFLVTLFRSPSLPLTEEIFHGGYEDEGDSRLSTERLLQLSLPPAADAGGGGGSSGGGGPAGSGSGLAGGGGGSGGNSAPPVLLERVLAHNFFDNRLQGINRKISGEKGKFAVDGWKMVSLLPYYCLQSEFVDQNDPANDRHFDRIMLPMVLKRYERSAATAAHPAAAASAAGRRNASPTRSNAPLASKTQAAVRTQRNVLVPYRLDFTDYVQLPPEKAASVGGDAGTRFVLVLRSVVCHLGGDSLSNGHYVAYAAERGGLATSAITTSKANKDIAAALAAAAAGSGPTAAAAAGSGPAAAAAGSGPAATPAGSGSSSGGGSSGTDMMDAAALRRLSLQEAGDVTWLRHDDMERVGPGGGFVRRIERLGDIAQLFGEELGLHCYMLFYEMIDLEALGCHPGLESGHHSRVQLGEILSLMRETSDHKVARDLHNRELELESTWKQARERRHGEMMCPVS